MYASEKIVRIPKSFEKIAECSNCCIHIVQHMLYWRFMSELDAVMQRRNFSKIIARYSVDGRKALRNPDSDSFRCERSRPAIYCIVRNAKRIYENQWDHKAIQRWLSIDETPRLAISLPLLLKDIQHFNIAPVIRREFQFARQTHYAAAKGDRYQTCRIILRPSNA